MTDTSTPTENPAPSPQPAILTTTAAATYLGLDPAAVRELCRTGAFPHAARRPPSGHWRIPLADLQQWRQDHPTPVAPAPTAQPASLRRLGSQVVAAVVFLAAIAAIISAAPIVADWVTPLLAAAPPPLPPEEFNVVVAGFGTRLADDSVTQSQAADDAGDMIFRAVSAVPEVDNARSWRAIPNGRILAVTPAEQDARAAAIAQESAADVVIYGTLAEDGYYTSLAPRFYLATQYSALEPEFSTTDLLTAPIEYVRGDGMQATAGARLLDQRLRVIHHFLAGLSYFDRAQFEASRTAFESAIAAATGQDAAGEAGHWQSVAGVEILYVLAGNAALRENNLGRALELYGAALAARPGYARALVGRGYTLFQMALGGSPQACTNPAAEGSPAVFAVDPEASATYDPHVVLDPAAGCVHLPSPLPTDPQRLGLLAERCYLEASGDRQSAAMPEIAAKIDLGLGQLYSWFALQGAPRWQEAAEHLQAVTRAYAAAPPGRQERMSFDAGFAHAWLGLNHVRASPAPTAVEIQAAVMSYQTAVDLLENAIFRPYHEPCIELYVAVIDNLKQWLYSHTVGAKNK